MNDMQMPGGQMKNRLGSDSASMSELFPVMGEKKNLIKKGHLIGVGTVFIYAVVLMSVLENPVLFRNLLGIGIGVGVYFGLYLACGKAKPWYVLASATACTAMVMVTPIWNLIYTIFYSLPGTSEKPTGLIETLVTRVIATGGAEELTKILPVVGLWFLGRKVWPKAGVTEPLDGILLAMASAMGFVFVETLGQYATNISEKFGNVFGLELAIVRILWAFKGHLAYSGYFGYFVGLAALKPKHAVKLLGIGYLCAAVMHGLWDTFADAGVVFQVLLGVVFYALLIAAILKARQLSPNRAENFATMVVPQAAAAAAVASPTPRPTMPPPPPPPPVMRPVAPQPVAPQRPVAPPQRPVVLQSPVMPQPPVQPHVAPQPAMKPVAANGLRLRVGVFLLALEDGSRFGAREIGGLTPAGPDGSVATVNHNPKDPSVLGLQNLSTTPWRATLPGGEVREVPCSKSVKLASGSKIDFGTVQGEVV